MEEELFEVANNKVFLLTVKLTSGETISIAGNQVIDMPEVIEARIGNKEDIIIIGYMGAKRELIEWYTITEVASK